MINKLKIEGNILKIVLLLSTLFSLIIGIITRLNIDSYTKYIILPTIIILYSYTLFINLLKEKINIKAYFYLGIILIVLLSYFIMPLASINKFLNIIVLLILTSIYIYSLINNNFKIDLNVYKWIIKVIPGYLFSNLDYLEDSLKELKTNNQKTRNILLGLVITLPITIILLLMLTGADAYFKSFISSLFININFDFFCFC